MVEDEIRPMAPVVRSASRIDRALLISVFPSSRVHSKQIAPLPDGQDGLGMLPLFRITTLDQDLHMTCHCQILSSLMKQEPSAAPDLGWLSGGVSRKRSPSSPTLSSDSSPMVRPANNPVKGTRMKESKYSGPYW